MEPPGRSRKISSTSNNTNTRRIARRYGFACTSCKARKVKCSGDQPVCRACRRAGDDCIWPTALPSAPRHSSDDAVDAELRDARARIRHLESALRSKSAVVPSVDGNRSVPDGVTSPERQRLAAAGRTPAGSSQHGSSGGGGVGGTHHGPAVASGTSPSTEGTLPMSATPLWFQVGIGEDGAVIYNGPTSRFHAGPLDEGDEGEDEAAERPATAREHGGSRRAQVETLRSQYDLIDSVWSPLIAAKPIWDGTSLNTEVVTTLLDIYWTWLHPLHNCVYKPCFVMDMALGGPCYSEFLLMCILGLAARHLPDKQHQRDSFRGVGKGDQFLTRAKELLLDELTAPKPRITTIQGLLILGGRQCAAGKSSEGWLYTGMAIRMMVDIGLHLDTTKLAGLERLTPAEIETRKRLFNSAYIWDKTLSLALGRPPSLTRRPYPPEDILDTFDDEKPWRPVHALEIIENAYEPSPTLNTATFSAFCELHQITTDMMLLFASTSRTDDFSSRISELDSRYWLWYGGLRQDLRMEDPTKLSQSPPPHIVSLNLIYHTLHILLRRPYLSSPDRAIRTRSTRECTFHSRKIHAIHSLYSRTFPHRLMTYQVSYCIYTAATVEARELKSAEGAEARQDAAARLAAAVKVLQDEASHTPGSGRSLDTIRRLLSARGGGGGWRTPTRRRRTNGIQPGEGAADSSESVESETGRVDLHTTRGASHVAAEHSQQDASMTTQPSDMAMNLDQMNQPLATSTTNHNNSNNMVWTTLTPGSENPPPWVDVFGGVGLDTGAGFHPDVFPWGTGDANSWMGQLHAFGNQFGVGDSAWEVPPG